MSESIAELIEAQDLNGLLRTVDALCERQAWDELVDLAERCEQAVERGKQLWPIAAHVDYRLALEAPGEYAADVLDPQPSRFAPGPLTEVAASTHTWAELADHIDDPLVAAYVAQERVLRGEVLEGDPRAHPEVLELPLRLLDWEPAYRLAVYRADHVEVPEAWEPRAPLRPVGRREARIEPDRELENALLEVVTPWVQESNGAARAVVVDGDARAAASALTFDRLRMGELTPAEALQRLAWAAASGGAHGRRRGAALGRFATMYLLTLLAGLEWPPDFAELGAAAARLRWRRFDEGEPERGWVLRIAVEHPDEGIAAALSASDVAEDAPAPAGGAGGDPAP